MGFEIRGKQLEILKDIALSLRRVLVVYDANVESPIHYASVQLLHKIGPRLGLTLIEKPIKSFAEAEEAVSRESVNGIFILCTNVFRSG